MILTPVGLVGRYIPEVQPKRHCERVNKYCTIIEASFFTDGSGELEVRFVDDNYVLTIQQEEFSKL